ncbi:MAG: hypothetical protein ACK5OB_01210 [Pirellula sp.]
MSAFEYKIFSGVPKMSKDGQSIDWSAGEAQLNSFVSQGWEVVSSHTTTYSMDRSGAGSHEPVITFLLRKQRQN